jgi:hypothetical protein
LIVKTAGSIRERLAERHIGDPLARGEGPRLSMELPDRELGPCEGFLARGSNEDYGEACALLDTSVKIPESSTGVCISLPCSLSFRIYIDHIIIICGRDSNTLAKP